MRNTILTIHKAYIWVNLDPQTACSGLVTLIMHSSLMLDLFHIISIPRVIDERDGAVEVGAFSSLKAHWLLHRRWNTCTTKLLAKLSEQRQNNSVLNGFQTHTKHALTYVYFHKFFQLQKLTLRTSGLHEDVYFRPLCRLTGAIFVVLRKIQWLQS